MNQSVDLHLLVLETSLSKAEREKQNQTRTKKEEIREGQRKEVKISKTLVKPMKYFKAEPNIHSETCFTNSNSRI